MWIQGQSAGGNDFSHPFAVGVGGAIARVSLGLIIGTTTIIPTIGGVALDAKPKPPTLNLDASLVDDLKQSWICVEATPDENGLLGVKGKKWKVEIVQRDFPVVTSGPTGRAPLAMLFYKAKQPQLFQIAMFNLRYVTSLPAKGERQHFFL
jgi:hypothetical protein